MTMDIASQSQTELKTPCSGDNCIRRDYSSSNPKPGLKRSFDVAFLMMPDDRLKQRQVEKQIRLEQLIENQKPHDLSPRHNHNPCNITDDMLNSNDIKRQINITKPPRVYNDPTTILPDPDNPRSAFTKVLHARLESPIPQPPLSPDQLSCPSLSPPISTTPPRSNNIYTNFHPEYPFNGSFQTISHAHAIAAQNNRIKHQLLYRPLGNPCSPDILPGYIPTTTTTFPFTNPVHTFVPHHHQDITGIVRNPAAAAILSTLIPPTLATTFSLTAQNVCAKCNISFRMTSDLVYHMRSHHKSDVFNDPNRRKREEKLKCPVCNESFRERHHLTRHMTAHQDKASDQNDSIEQTQRRK